MYNREKVVEIIAVGICQTEAYKFVEGFGYSDANAMANAAVDNLIAVGFLNFDKHTGAITEAAHLANTVLGEVCRKEETSNIGVSGADSSETGDVGQNLGDFEPLIKGESPCDWDW